MKAVYIYSVKLIFIVLALSYSASLFCQQLPNYLFYRDNWGILNPAGLTSHYLINGRPSMISATYRQQWSGIEDAPSTIAVQTQHILERQNIALGGFILNDQIGAIGHTGVYANFAYLIPIGSGREIKTLSIGLTAGVVQYRADPTDINFLDDGDFVAENATTSFNPDFGLGIFYHDADRYYAGVSVPQAFGLTSTFESDSLSFDVKRLQHVYGIFGGYIRMGEAMVLEPSTWIRYVANTPLSVDVNLRFQFNNTFWVGTGIGSLKVLHLEFGVTLAEQINLRNSLLKIGLGFERSMQTYSASLGNTYEINVGYAFGG